MSSGQLHTNELAFAMRDLDHTKTTATIHLDKNAMARIVGRSDPYKSLPRMFRPALEEVADYVRGVMIPRVFEQEGPSWPPLAPRTVGERIAAGYKGHHPILIRTRDLFNELTSRSHPKHVEIIRVGKNARIEIGGSSKKFIENQLGVPAKNLPPRPMIPGTGYIPLADADRYRITEILHHAMRKARMR